MDPQKIFSLVIAGASVLAIAGVVIVYLKGSVSDATIKQLRENFNAMKDSRDEEARENVKKDATIAEQGIRIESLEAQVSTLQAVVTNKEEVEAIARRLELHHIESMESLREIQEAVST